MRGREREWRAVLDLLKAAGGGRGTTLLVEGEPGAGKTLLLAEAASAASARGFSLLTGTADALGRLIPLATLRSALEEPYGGERAQGEDARAGLVERLSIRLRERSAAGPLLVALDDLQWADPDTLRALRTLQWQLSAHPVAWMLARTPSHGDAEAGCLFGLLEKGGATRVELGPLAADAVAQVVADVLGAPPEPGLLALASAAGGSPLLLSELLVGLREEGAVEVSGGRAQLLSASLPDRAHVAARRLLDRLSPAARHLVEAAAVLGLSFSMDDVAEFLGVSPAALLPALEESLSAGMLMATPESLAFRHEIVWRAVAAALPPPVRQALHRQIGEVLLRRGGATAQAAAHLAEGVRQGDRRVLAALDQAVAEILPSAPGAAADLAAKALELTDLADPARFARTVAAIEAQIGAGRLDDAANLVQAALARPLPAPARAELRRARSAVLYLRGQAAEAAEDAEAVLAEPDVPNGLRDRATLALLHAATALPDRALVRKHAEAVLGASQTHGAALIVGALTGLAVAEWDAGRLAEGVGLAREAVRRADPATPDQTGPRLALAAMLADLRELDEARALVRDESGEPGAPGEGAWAAGPAALRARIALADGRLEEAVSAAEAALGRADAGGTRLFSPLAAAVLGEVALRRGDLRAAARHVEGGHARLSAYGATHGTARCAVVAARVTEARDGLRQARALVEGLCAVLADHRSVLVGEPATAAWMVRVALAAGDRERARTVAATAESLALGNPELPAVQAMAAHARGLLDGDVAALDLATGQAADPWARASAAEDLGALLGALPALPALPGGGGDRRDAVRRLDEALSCYEQSGALRDAARVRRRLRRMGVRHRHWAYADRPVSGWESLTDTERAISLLVAEGWTNRQVADQIFVSVHTVAFHLRHVFRKLHIRSRVELARLAIEQGPRPGPHHRPGLRSP